MSRRSSLPGADELFRATAAAPAPRLSPVPSEPAVEVSEPAPERPTRPPAVRRSSRQTGERAPSGRQRHDEKITVYVSADELMDLERARLTLRGDHGMGVDRGRIVREALAVVLSDLEAKGDDSILVRRLRGR